MVGERRFSGRPAEGVPCLRQALQLDPDLFEAHYPLGVELLQQKALDEAEPTIRNGPAAGNMARRACEITEYKNAAALACLADSYAATVHDFRRA